MKSTTQTTSNRQDFVKTFDDIARHKHRYEVFTHFVTMSAISIHNSVNMNDGLEKEYLQIVGKYSKDEVLGFAKLLAIVVELLNEQPDDILGSLFMDLELGNSNTGQFFTPFHLSLMMAEMIYGNDLENLEKPFITLSEPACGAGGMVLAFARVMMRAGHIPAFKLWTQCVDIDRTVALMCYIQLSLWHIPAQVIVGNTLSLEFRESFFTPAHYLHNWDMKLNDRRATQLLTESPQSQCEGDLQAPPKPLEADKKEAHSIQSQSVEVGEQIQFDFGF